MSMKNVEVIPMLNGIAKIADLKLGGVELKAILKNKKALVAAYEDLEEVRKKLIEQYKSPAEEGSDEIKFTDENQKLIDAEWQKVSFDKADVELVKLNSAKFDQLTGITLEQMEALEMMAE